MRRRAAAAGRRAPPRNRWAEGPRRVFVVGGDGRGRERKARQALISVRGQPLDALPAALEEWARRMAHVLSRRRPCGRYTGRQAADSGRPAPATRRRGGPLAQVLPLLPLGAAEAPRPSTAPVCRLAPVLPPLLPPAPPPPARRHCLPPLPRPRLRRPPLVRRQRLRLVERLAVRLLLFRHFLLAAGSYLSASMAAARRTRRGTRRGR